MLPEITQLLRLQERDSLIRGMQKDLKDVPLLQQRAKARLADDQAAVEAASQRAKEIEVKIKGVELDIQTRQTSIKRLQDQQFETRKNDEFQALGHEIERYQAEVRSHEDKELEHMEALEAAKKELAAAQARLAESSKHVNEDLKQLDGRAAGLQARLESVKTERQDLAAPIEPSALDLYERLLKNRAGTAVVPLEHAICGGCHMKVVLSTIQSLKQQEKITQCEMCGRILYLAE